MLIRGTSVAQEGSTAYDVASVYGHEDMMKELAQHTPAAAEPPPPEHTPTTSSSATQPTSTAAQSSSVRQTHATVLPGMCTIILLMCVFLDKERVCLASCQNTGRED